MPEPSIPSGSDTAVALQEQIAAETSTFLDGVARELSQWFTQQSRVALGIDEAAGELVQAIADLSTGGKRMRAQLLYWGWRSAGGAKDSPIPVQAAAGLELFQSAALIHDDVIDRSDTRRSMPSVHKRLEGLHIRRRWDQEPAHFGVASAILIGDLALTWSEQLFGHALTAAGHPVEAAQGFNLMRTEVMIGQYLDIHAEVAAADVPSDRAYRRAVDVLRYKSAKYSAEHPVALGALLAGRSEAQIAQHRKFALALGEAFQIRDDILGIYGDPETTGKPAGDDLREGKRTVVIATHFERATDDQAAAVTQVLGRAECKEDAILRARQAIQDSGALDRVEASVDTLTRTAGAGIDDLQADAVVAAAFHRILQSAVRRRR